MHASTLILIESEPIGRPPRCCTSPDFWTRTCGSIASSGLHINCCWGIVRAMIYQSRQPFSPHWQSRPDASYLTVRALGIALRTGEPPCMLVYCYTPYTPDRTGLCSRKLIAVSCDCAVMLAVILWTFDNLLWPEAPSVLHIHLSRAASLNSKGFEEVFSVLLCDCWSSSCPQVNLLQILKWISSDVRQPVK